ncbi:von Willebrand factor A domain-containing protein 3B-like isoform X2 [Babylonia areolata]|uniref:von Willebrand factor A domain-containing protein 3B-like isoform X2 n=1 Tax=Babylonia areolata TaxID=304850 RepID=UPI003FD5C0CB
MTSMSAEFLTVDPYLKNAFSSAVKFDISHKSGHSNALQSGRVKDVGEAEEINLQTSPPKEWEVDVRPQVSTQKWLQLYGLRKYRLKMEQILPSIGFKLSDDFDPVMKRPISSRYSQGMFQQIFGANGRTFNVTCSRDKLVQLKRRLEQAMGLYRRRLEWLTSESRRIFGVVEEKSVTIVMDIRNMSPDQFDQYRTALQRVLKEQFQHVTKFNLIRAAEDMALYNLECIPLSHDTLEKALQWMWALDRLAPVSNTACAEAVLRAMNDPHTEAVYLFTEGTSVDCCRELLQEKVSSAQRKTPVHVVSFNCDSSDTVKFLRNFAASTGGKFHVYAVVMELDAYEALPNDPLTSKANILLKRKTFGGIPPGAGVREDVVLLFEEMEEARCTLQQIEALIERAPEPSRVLADAAKGEKLEKGEKDEQYMSSKQWLAVYGLEARKLNVYDILSGVAFKHQDGVVEILERPPSDQTDAVGREKLVHAQYCERFPVVKWKDGRVVHVQVTPEVHRNYESRMQVALSSFQQRIDWLKQGSRALFGTVVEEEIYILIDTSASMQHSIQFVKERLFVLMQEQIRHKAKFNMIAFNSKITGWRDRLVEVSERALQSAWTWVQGLTCWGSTNTYTAIQTALADAHAQAVYLLTDGRPDQPPKSIIAQVQMQKRVPIHTISFNCNDTEANEFLFELAQATEGRYHYYHERGNPVEQPEAWQSQDIKLLKDEMARGFEYLDQLAELRDQCASLGWKKEVETLKKCSKGHSLPDAPGRVSAVPPLEPKELFRPNTPPRPQSAPPPQSPRHTPSPPPNRRPSSRPSSAMGQHPARSLGSPRATRRPQSAKAVQQSVKTSHRGRRLVAGNTQTLQAAPSDLKWKGHTRTSLLRTMTSSGRFSPSEWVLPETSKLFEQQSNRQRQLAENSDPMAFHKKRRQRLARSYEASPKLWLKKHGLVASRLTILDALAPTLVPHRSSYIPILDKHVLSRVFDEIMPIAHVSGGQRNRVHLVNPSGVNLKEYEEKLEKALTKYRQRLDSMVWKALPETVKQEFDSEEPVPFSEHRGKILQALSEEGWPVTEADIAILEQEIEKGEKFLQQAKDLRSTAAEPASDALSDTSSLRRSLNNSVGASQVSLA